MTKFVSGDSVRISPSNCPPVTRSILLRRYEEPIEAEVIGFTNGTVVVAVDGDDDEVWAIERAALTQLEERCS